MQQSVSSETLKKETHLINILQGYGAVVIAYSGGVDSTYLADVAHDALGKKAHLIIADSPSIPREELRDAVDIARQRGWNLTTVRTKEFDSENFLKNDNKRCYYCKTHLFEVMRKYAEENDIPVIVYGETADDGFDSTRVGVRAARESNARAPLAEAGFTKDEIRACSRARELPTWEKPSFACLASRIPTGNPVSPEILLKVEKAEEALRAAGFRQYRARHHDTLCRIEVSTEDFPLLLQSETRDKIVEALSTLGYRYVTLDLTGYRTGSTAG